MFTIASCDFVCPARVRRAFSNEHVTVSHDSTFPTSAALPPTMDSNRSHEQGAEAPSLFWESGGGSARSGAPTLRKQRGVRRERGRTRRNAAYGAREVSAAGHAPLLRHADHLIGNVTADHLMGDVTADHLVGKSATNAGSSILALRVGGGVQAAGEVEVAAEVEDLDLGLDLDEDAAASVIQSHLRGHHARSSSMHLTDGPVAAAPVAAPLAAPLARQASAETIQRHLRGHASRRSSRDRGLMSATSARTIADA